jgi:hypothetical protein
LIRDAQRQERLLKQQERLRRRWRAFGVVLMGLLANAGAAIGGFVHLSSSDGAGQPENEDGNDQHS